MEWELHAAYLTPKKAMSLFFRAIAPHRISNGVSLTGSRVSLDQLNSKECSDIFVFVVVAPDGK